MNTVLAHCDHCLKVGFDLAWIMMMVSGVLVGLLFMRNRK